MLVLPIHSQIKGADDHIVSEYKRISTKKGYAFINNQGDTIIPPGKYKFLNPIDDEGMILATNFEKKRGYIDIDENILIPFIYDDLGIFAQGRVFAKKDGKLGYLDRSGKTVIPFQFNEAKYFYKPGLAIVRQDKKYGLIDTLGNYVLADMYDKIDYSRGNEIAAVKQNNKWGFYFPKDNVLTDFKYDKIFEHYFSVVESNSETVKRDFFFHKGLALVENEGRHALINREMEEVVSFDLYDKIYPMNYEGYSIVVKDNCYGIIDPRGKLKVDLVNDHISNEALASYEKDFNSFLVENKGAYQILNEKSENEIGFIFDKVEITRNNYYIARKGKNTFLYNTDGKLISDSYSAYDYYNKGFLVKKDSKMGAINREGEIILPFEYDSIYYPRLENHLYASKNNKFGVIDFNGKIIIPFEYENITRVWYDHNDEQENNLIVQKNKKLGTINLKNEIVIPLIYDGICTWIEYSPDDHYVKLGDKYGMVKPNGEVLIPAQYDELYYYSHNLILVRQNDKYGVINDAHQTIFEIDKERIIIDFDYWGFNDEEHPNKIIIKQNDVWTSYTPDGSVIKKGIPEEEIFEAYPYARDRVEFYQMGEMLLLPI